MPRMKDYFIYVISAITAQNAVLQVSEYHDYRSFNMAEGVSSNSNVKIFYIFYS